MLCITVITLKRDGILELALDAKEINNAIQKNKYHMQIIDELLQQLNLIATNPTSPGNTWFTSLDLKYAYGQLPLDHKTREKCNFPIKCGKATGTHQFLAAFYGLTNTPAEFQCMTDALLLTLPNTFDFMDGQYTDRH